MLLDPNFFKAIGKVKGWDEKMQTKERPIYTGAWKDNMHISLDKIIEKDLDHAIEWLYKLIKE